MLNNAHMVSTDTVSTVKQTIRNAAQNGLPISRRWARACQPETRSRYTHVFIYIFVVLSQLTLTVNLFIIYYYY
jgi:hypothetical protein